MQCPSDRGRKDAVAAPPTNIIPKPTELNTCGAEILTSGNYNGGDINTCGAEILASRLRSKKQNANKSTALLTLLPWYTLLVGVSGRR